MLDIFNDDAFSVVSLTESINLLPYMPARLGQLNLFRQVPVRTPTAVIEFREGKLVLIPTQARGSRENVVGSGKRNVRTLSIPHLPLDAAVLADDVMGIRAFGSEDQLEPISAVVNEKLEQLKQSHELTWEWHRMGALTGVVLDADGTSELYNLFDLFNVTETEVEFDFTDEDTVKLGAESLKRTMRHKMGGIPYTGIHALCGDQFWDALVTSAAAKAAYNRWNDGQFFREGQSAFPWCGITWENYDGYLNDDFNFIDPEVARFFPTGSPNLFQVALAPADFMETVNTLGQPYYAKQERMPFDKGVNIHSQSNPLHFCTRPQVLIKGTMVAGSEE